MTKKDFIIIATCLGLVIKQSQKEDSELTGHQQDILLDIFLNSLQQDNARFDRQRFIDYVNKIAQPA